MAVHVISPKMYIQEWCVDHWDFDKMADGPSCLRIENFFLNLATDSFPAVGWFLQWNKKLGMFTLKEKRDSVKGVVEVVKEYMYSSALGFVKLPLEICLDNLLRGYVKDYEGLFMVELDQHPLPGPIEIGEWFQVSSDETLIIINHDGDPLYVLNTIE